MQNPQVACRRYEGRVAIVTGSAQGLGRVIALRLAQEGAHIVLSDIQEARLQVAADLIVQETGRRVLMSAGDLREAATAERLARLALETFGRIDTLVNNAAALIRMPLVEFTEEQLQTAVSANVWPALRCCRAIVPTMIEAGYGRIVNVGGEAWRTGTPYHTILGGIGKGGLVGLTATLAGELGEFGITVNCVSPGGIAADDTGALEENARAFSQTPAEVAQRLSMLGSARGFGIQRPARPEEVAAAIAYFGSPEASYVTGQHLGVNGGRVMI